jgi:hypothetical protein
MGNPSVNGQLDGAPIATATAAARRNPTRHSLAYAVTTRAPPAATGSGSADGRAAGSSGLPGSPDLRRASSSSSDQTRIAITGNATAISAQRNVYSGALKSWTIG